MASQAIGLMTVVLSKDKVKEFEGFFDENNYDSFLNAEIKLDSTTDISEELEERLYDFSCSLSLESCLIDCYGYNIRDVCDLLKVQELDIDVKNHEEEFAEKVIFKAGKCTYTASELGSEEVTVMELTPLKEEMEAE
ncbi:MAG: hypothetical protein J6A63_08825 [Clostridia bacterium]|nr:hypothetical protein [Clostridia bacterium]